MRGQSLTSYICAYPVKQHCPYTRHYFRKSTGILKFGCQARDCEGWGISKKLKRGFARKCFSKSFFSIRISRKVVESSKSNGIKSRTHMSNQFNFKISINSKTKGEHL